MTNVERMPVAAKVKHWVGDSYRNLMSGLGMIGRDKATAGQYVYEIIPDNQLEAAYRTDWIMRKAIRIPAFDSTRMWRAWQADKKDIETIEKAEKTFLVKQKVRQVITLARLYGGSALVLGVDGDPASELKVESVGKDGLKFLHVVTKNELTAGGQMIRDVMSPYYGQPEYWQRFAQAGTEIVTNLRIHPSRIIRFVGEEVPDVITKNEYWGDPTMLSIKQAVLSAASVTGSIAHLISEAKIDIYKIKGLSEALSTDPSGKKLIARFADANVMKSVVNSVVLDTEEELDRIQVTFAGMPDVLQMYLLIASGAVDVPATRFLGQSPVGMNATGESDMRNYYDRLKSDQEMTLTPTMYPLDEILIRTALGKRDESIFYNWNSLWQLDDVQKAALAKSKADTVKIDVDTALVPESALAKGRQNQLIEDGTYPGLQLAIEDAEAAGENAPHDPTFQVQEQKKEEQATAHEQNLAMTVAKAKLGGGGPPKLKLVKKGDAWVEGTPRRFVKTSKGRLLDTATKRIVAHDIAPRTLYVRRDLVNTGEFKKWAKGQGFDNVIDDIHVTVLCSKTAVDWRKMGGEDWGGDDGKITVPPGGMRVVESLGDEGAIVLHFTSSRLAWRHESMLEQGASSDYQEYQPHVTISYTDPDVDLSEVEPYRGALVFGPEIFEEIDPEGYTPPSDDDE